MKRLSFAPLLVATGCLYTGTINKPPVVVSATLSETSTFKGSSVTVTASATDDEDAAATLSYEFTVEATDGGAAARDCDYAIEAIQPGGNSATVTFYRTGIFSISVVATDHLKSPSAALKSNITILDGAPGFTAGAKLIPTSASNLCALYTAGEAIPLRLDGDVVDLDQGARAPACDTTETMTYTWRITRQPSGAPPAQLTLFADGGCTAPTAGSGVTLPVPSTATQVCLWTAAGATSTTSMYSVAMDASDGTTRVTSATADVPVAADAPPCITGTDLVEGSYVLDRTQRQSFQVLGVADDRDPFPSDKLTFAWSLWRESDPTWRAVPSHPQPSYDLDGSLFGVGEHAKLRVEAIDRTGGRAACDINKDDVCLVTSCASAGQACHKWKTWFLELR